MQILHTCLDADPLNQTLGARAQPLVFNKPLRGSEHINARTGLGHTQTHPELCSLTVHTVMPSARRNQIPTRCDDERSGLINNSNSGRISEQLVITSHHGAGAAWAEDETLTYTVINWAVLLEDSMHSQCTSKNS